MADRNDKVMAYRTFVQTLKKMRCKMAYGFRHRWQKRRVGNKHMDIGIYLLGLDILARPIGVLHLQTPVLHHLTPPTPAEF